MIDENSTKEEALEAVKSDWGALRYASDELRADREVVLEAVKQDWRALRYAGGRLLDLFYFEFQNDVLEILEKKEFDAWLSKQ